MANNTCLTPSLETLMGEKITKKQILGKLRESPSDYEKFLQLTEQLQKEFLDFCSGNRGIKITYDPFFKYVLNPDASPERISSLLSVLLKQEIWIQAVLPNDGGQLTDESSLIIMDIIVRLMDGSMANIEIQKVPYLFPGERMDCYQSDMLLRQYNRVRSRLGKAFHYKDLKTVYTIVLYETSTKQFHELSPVYLHQGEITYDTGLSIHHLQKNVLIALDIFKENTQTITNELEAWLYFLSSDDPIRIWEICEKYPFFRDMYHDIFQFRTNPKEVLYMFSEALRIMDRNTVKLMVDEWKSEIEDLKAEAEELKAETEGLKAETEKLKAETQEKTAENQDLKAENAALKKQLELLQKKSSQQ